MRMCFRSGLKVHEGDAVAFVAGAAKAGEQYDLVLLDAYNGANRVPTSMTCPGVARNNHACICTCYAYGSSKCRCSCSQYFMTVCIIVRTKAHTCLHVTIFFYLTSSGLQAGKHVHKTRIVHSLSAYMCWPATSPSRSWVVVYARSLPGDIVCRAGSGFLEDLAAVLHCEHGTLVMNLHGGRLPSPLVQLVQAASGNPLAGAGFDASSQEGAEVLRLSMLFR